MDYKALIENAKVCCGDTRVDFCTGVCINPSDKRGDEVRWCRQWLIKDLYTALEETLKRAEAAEARAEKAERERDAAVKSFESLVKNDESPCVYCKFSGIVCSGTTVEYCGSFEYLGKMEE